MQWTNLSTLQPVTSVDSLLTPNNNSGPSVQSSGLHRSSSVMSSYMSAHRRFESQLSWNTASDASIDAMNVAREQSIARNLLKAAAITDPGSDSGSEASETKDSGRWSPKVDDPTDPMLDRINAHIRVLRQPEEKHRARYLSEGSRGAVKDTTRTSFVTIQLVGYARPTTVEIYAGVNNETGQPHPFYRVIKVAGKGGSQIQHTPCQEVVRNDGVHTLQVVCRPEHDMVAVLDCVGILKICSTQVPTNQQSKKRNKGGSKQTAAVRLICRAQIPSKSSTTGFRQICTMTYPILCVQQLGHPEVLKCSISKSDPMGGDDLMIIGRNFDAHTVILFREYKEDGTLVWSAEAPLDKKLLHQCHLVATVPTYRQLSLQAPVEVSVTIKCQNKSSHPMPFFYVPKGTADKVYPASDIIPAPSVMHTPVTDWEPPQSSIRTINTLSALPIGYFKSSPAPTPQPTVYAMASGPQTPVTIKPELWPSAGAPSFAMHKDYKNQQSAPGTSAQAYTSILATPDTPQMSVETVFYGGPSAQPMSVESGNTTGFDEMSISYGGEPTRKLVRYSSQENSTNELTPTTGDFSSAVNTPDPIETYTNL